VDWFGHIYGDDAVLAFAPADLEKVATDTLGNAATPEDGWDALMGSTVTDFGTILDDIAALGGTIGDILDTAAGLGVSAIENNTPLLESDLATATAAVQSVDSTLAPLIGPTAPPSGAPTPPYVYACPSNSLYNVTYSMSLAAHPEQDTTLSMHNSGTTDFIISSVTLLQGAPALFTMDDLTPVTIKPGGTLPFCTVRGHITEVGQYSCAVRMSSPNEPGPATVCLTFTITP